MNFTKYRSIENSYRAKFLDLIRIAGFASETWVVEEKVHGANFSVWIDEDNNVRLAKRSGFISENGTGFYRADKLKEELEVAAKNLRALLPDVEGEIAVYGELFGGNYPHPSVMEVKDVSAVQKGVYYSPDIHFIAYDLWYGGEFANVALRQELLEKAGFLSMPILFSGNLDDCLQYPNAFDSIVPDLLGLPSIQGNICEGVVIKPFEPRYLKCGTRVILKNKNEKFTEKEKQPKTKKAPEPFPENLQALFDGFSAFANTNRVANVCSKIGEVDITMFKRVMNETRADAMEEFTKDYPEFLELPKADRKRLDKLFGSLIAVAIKEHLMAVEKGEA